jgi:hypothetical protein
MVTTVKDGTDTRIWRAALSLVGAFFIFQLWTLDYGTHINDLPHINQYVVGADVVAGSALERPVIAGAGGEETMSRGMARFKLYSVEADEALNIMALSRIHPSDWAFDPHFYQYGGAWLYPLGGWYAALSKIGVIQRLPVAALLQNPEHMDDIYVWGRIFVLLSVSLAALVLFKTLLYVSTPATALLGAALFLVTPATITFSQVMKPHWYALLWINVALLMIVQSFVARHMARTQEVLLGIALGLAVGASSTNGLFAAFAWLAMLFLIKGGTAPLRVLFSVPLIAVVTFLITNPYVLLNWEAYRAESSLASGWFTLELSGYSVWAFVENSLTAGFGIGFCILLSFVVVRELLKPTKSAYRWIALGVPVAVLVIAVLTSSLSAWHTNVRYIAGLLPVSILLMCLIPWPAMRKALGVVLAVTLLQSVPLKMAYMDENDPQRSTRLSAARWVEKNLSREETLCLGTRTPAPYDVPPIDFERYIITTEGCQYMVKVERQSDNVRTPVGFSLEKRFVPRYSPEHFPLVFSHINPQISVYRRE